VSLQSPLGKALGHGSAKDGTGHWWAQRLTAVALVPLSLWFALAMLGLLQDGVQGNYDFVAAWLREPVNAILVLLLVIALLYHSSLGLQVVIEDYVHQPAVKVTALAAVKLAHLALAVSAVYAVISVAAGVGS